MVNRLTEAEEEAFSQAKLLSDDFRKTFETDHGERVLEYLMRIGGVVPGAATIEPNEILFNNGKRYVVENILINVDVSPNRLRLLMRSAMEVQQL